MASGANKDLILALEQIEKDKNISKETLLEALENSLVAACKAEFDKKNNKNGYRSDNRMENKGVAKQVNITVTINPQNGSVGVYAEKEVVETVEDPATEIDVVEAKLKYDKYEVGDKVKVEVTPKNFGRIAAQKAKQVVVQKIREEERKVLYRQYAEKEKDIVTGIVQRYNGTGISINLGKIDTILSENEQVKTEKFRRTDRIKLYVIKVEDSPKGPRITVSRTHPDLVKRLFEAGVTEVKDGTVEIKNIAREAGSRTKIAVYTSNPDVDPVGACVGMNGSRVNAIVEELRGEKIDIITWDEDPAILIENALSPAKVVSVQVDTEEKSARVVVPDYQLSLAIGKEGQNARLAARLTGYKIDIKSESQAEKESSFEDSMESESSYQAEPEQDVEAEETPSRDTFMAKNLAEEEETPSRDTIMAKNLAEEEGIPSRDTIMARNQAEEEEIIEIEE